MQVEEPNPHPKVSSDESKAHPVYHIAITVKTLDIETLDEFVMVVVEREIKLNEMSTGMVENNVFRTGSFIESKKLWVYGLVIKSIIEPSLNRRGHKYIIYILKKINIKKLKNNNIYFSSLILLNLNHE